MKKVKVLLLVVVMAIFGAFSSTVALASAVDTSPYAYNSVDPTWDSYSDNTSGISFSYPQDWSLSAQMVNLSNDGLTKMVTLTSPDGFVLTYYSGLPSADYRNVVDTPSIWISSVIELDSSITNSGSPLYIVQSGANLALYSRPTNMSWTPTPGSRFGFFYPEIAEGHGICAFTTSVMFPFTTNTNGLSSNIQVGKLILASIRCK